MPPPPVISADFKIILLSAGLQAAVMGSFRRIFGRITIVFNMQLWLAAERINDGVSQNGDELLSPMILLVKALKIEKLLQSHSPHKGITA